jgi:hypothetical protein
MENDHMLASLSFVALRDQHKISSLFMRVIRLYKRQATNACAVSALLCLVSPLWAANSTVNVYVPTDIANDLIASTTSQFLGTLKPSTFFSNTFSFTITGRNPDYKPPQVSSGTASVRDLLNTIVTISTSTYPYGWSDGMEYGRWVDLGRVSYYVVNCSTPSVFGASTTTWNAGVCNDALSRVHQDIYELNLATPTVVPGY